MRLLLALLLCAGCAAGRVAPFTPGEIPPMPSMGADLPAGSTAYANDDLAEVFTRLTLDMEWGASRPHLVRYEAPVRVRLSGEGAGGYRDFTALLLRLLARDSQVDIAPTDDEAAANLHVRFVNGQEWQRMLPSQACIVAHGAPTWSDFRRDPNRYVGDAMVSSPVLEQATVFIPQNHPPYRVRRCLIEEIIQALGPANDFFGVADTIFNDDSAHVWPTRLDLLMLRVLYDDTMRTGLGRDETRAAARRVLAALNPLGEDAGALRIARRLMADPTRWVLLNQKAHDSGAPTRARLSSAKEALDSIARNEPGSIRHCYSLVEFAELTGYRDPDTALGYYAQAERVCARAVGESDIRLARLRLHRADALQATGRHRDALALLEPLEAAFAAHGDEAALARVYAMLMRGYLETGRDARAADAMQRALLWGRYAFGVDEPSVRALEASIGG